MKRASLILAAFFGFAYPDAAQNTWVTVTGRVTDPTHAAVPRAMIRIENPESRLSEQIAADANGVFVRSLLPPGIYSVYTSAGGFREDVRESIVAEAGETVRLEIVLQVAEISELVSVSEKMDPLETESASRSSVIDSIEIKAFPILGRQAYNVLSLSPGVLYSQLEFGANGYSGLRNWNVDGTDVINGGVPGTNQFLLNNAPVSLVGRWEFSPSTEAIHELRVLTNTYDAEYGRTGGGTVSTTLRSTGNEYHGTAYEFLHNGITDANSFDNNLIGRGIGKHIAHQYGGTLEAPVRKNKDFLFVSLDNYWEVAPSPVVADTPPLPLRDGQHFTEYKVTIYNPYSAIPCKTDCLGPFVREPFAGNVIPQSMISPIGAAILALYPAPNARGVTQNYNATGSTSHYNYIQPIVRWDHNFGDRDRLYGMAAIDHESAQNSANGFPSPADFGSGNVERFDQNYILDWTRVFSPNVVGNIRASFGRFTQYFPDSSCLDCLTAESLGIELPHAPTVTADRAPHIDLSSYSSIIGNSYLWYVDNQADLSPSITVTRGHHIIHAGGEFTLAGLGRGGPGRANGEFSFDKNWTSKYSGVSSGYNDGSSVADLLLGLPSTGYVDYLDSSYLRWPYFAGYVQDNWKIRPNLTLSLGLRYDVQIPFHEINNRLNTGFNFSAVNPLSPQILQQWNANESAWNAAHPNGPAYPNAPSAILGGPEFQTGSQSPFNTDWTDIQPRFGIAWNLLPKTVFRAGAGIFYRTLAEYGSNYGFNTRTYYQSSVSGGQYPSAATPSGPLSLQNPFPQGLTVPQGAAAGLDASIGDQILFDGRDQPVPRTYEYSAGFQRELPGLMLLEADYTGNITVHDKLLAQLSSPALTTPFTNGSNAPYLQTQLPNPFYGILPAASQLGGSRTLPLAALLRPFPEFNGIDQINFPVARYRYDSLQIRLEKRVLDVAPAGILSFVFSYTYSKSFSDDHRLNPWNFAGPNAEQPVHELSASDRPNILGAAATWDLPFGWGRRYLSNVNSFWANVINSWTVDGVYTYTSGTPVSFPNAIFTCASDAAPGGPTQQEWFNNTRSCYQTRSVYAFRTGPDIFSNVRTPAASQLNMAISKTFWINDRISLQLRADAYNVTNTPIFPGPNTDLTDPRFGQLPLTQLNVPRYFTIGLRLAF